MFSAAFESQQGDEALPLVQLLVAAGANRAPQNATGSIAARIVTLRRSGSRICSIACREPVSTREEPYESRINREMHMARTALCMMSRSGALRFGSVTTLTEIAWKSSWLMERFNRSNGRPPWSMTAVCPGSAKS